MAQFHMILNENLDEDICMAGLEPTFVSCDEAVCDAAVAVGPRDDDFAYGTFEVVPVCWGCGRNASSAWWKCCTFHVSEDGPDVLCQTCVEFGHPGEEEFQRN